MFALLHVHEQGSMCEIALIYDPCRFLGPGQHFETCDPCVERLSYRLYKRHQFLQSLPAHCSRLVIQSSSNTRWSLHRSKASLDRSNKLLRLHGNHAVSVNHHPLASRDRLMQLWLSYVESREFITKISTTAIPNPNPNPTPKPSAVDSPNH